MATCRASLALLLFRARTPFFKVFTGPLVESLNHRSFDTDRLLGHAEGMDVVIESA